MNGIRPRAPPSLKNVSDLGSLLLPLLSLAKAVHLPYIASRISPHAPAEGCGTGVRTAPHVRSALTISSAVAGDDDDDDVIVVVAVTVSAIEFAYLGGFATMTTPV